MVRPTFWRRSSRWASAAEQRVRHRGQLGSRQPLRATGPGLGEEGLQPPLPLEEHRHPGPAAAGQVLLDPCDLGASHPDQQRAGRAVRPERHQVRLLRLADPGPKAMVSSHCQQKASSRSQSRSTVSEGWRAALTASFRSSPRSTWERATSK